MAERIARRLILAAVLALVSSACSVSPTSTPPLAGPSGFALSFALTATPDSISQDGASQSSIVVTALDVNGKAVSGVTFRLNMFVGGQPGAYGTLSGSTIVTGSNGQANVVYTAPPPPAAGANPATCAPVATSISLPGTCVTISATPISTGFASGTVSQSVVIHLVPIGIVLPPSSTPTAQFVITPTPVTTNVATNFDASSSCAGPGTGTTSPLVCAPTSNVIVSYSWGFGDGTLAMGRVASHSYKAPGSYTVTLTVVNDGGKFASTTQTITVTAATLPTAVFVFSPTVPTIGQVIQFNASSSVAAPGHSIVSYVWNWGDGSTGTSQLTSHTYTAAGTYAVTLTTTDDAGNSFTSAATDVAVSSGNPTASFTFITGLSGHTLSVNGSASAAQPGSSIVSYSYSWGDGQSASSASPLNSHGYANAGTYLVTLTVTDNLGRTGVLPQSVTVP
jgi:PKD repeat protein